MTCIITVRWKHTFYLQTNVVCKASFTRTVNFFVSDTFDVFDGHFDGQNGCATHLDHQMSVTVGTMLNFDGDFVKLVDTDTGRLILLISAEKYE